MIDFTYLVTKDTIETLERKYSFTLGSKIKGEIKQLEDNFLSDFWKYIPENLNKTTISTSEISSELENKARRNGYPIVSLDRIYFTNADKYLEVTRLTNPKTGEVKIAERPGNNLLEKQIEDLKKEYDKVVLADVGAFEGCTLLEICNKLEKKGIEIEEICLGISSNEANNKINNNRKLSTLRLFAFYEWVEMRDFLGIDGRNVGLENGVRTFIPYWENLAKWASIPKENEQNVSELCKDYNKNIIGLLWQEGYDLKKIGKPVRFDKDG